MLDILAKKRFMVIGLGESGKSVSTLLAKKGFEVLVTDDKEEKVLAWADYVKESDPKISVKAVYAKQALGELEKADCLVVSPGVPLSHPLVEEAVKSSINVTGELEVAYRFCHSKIIAVTGTNGKSTVTDLIGKIVQAAGIDCIIAGNIGTPLSSVVLANADPAVLVLEVSSFQLDTIDQFKADIGVVLNITSDHLDRYDNSIEVYASSKKRIMNRADKDSFLIYNDEDAWCKRLAFDFCGEKIPFSSTNVLQEGIFLRDNWITRRWRGGESAILDRNSFTPIGGHNTENALAAVGAVTPLGIGKEIISAALSAYRPLPHRMEPVRIVEGVTYINDSKATNVDAAVKSLQSLEGRVILIMGGRDKNGDFKLLRPYLKSVRKLILIGEASGKIKEAIRGACPVALAGSMQEAVRMAEETAAAGDTVLLAPGCASFDMFKNYEERGRVFKEIVDAM